MTDTRKLLLKAADIAELEGERKVHFLNANAVRVNKSLGAVGRAQDVSDYPKAKKRPYRNSGAWDLVDLDAIENPK